uniref:VWFD domain-containing protein n=2 Tax=Sinocyclocheilus grahami TaxID=75366 RepID=A0A672NKM8_SINGR
MIHLSEDGVKVVESNGTDSQYQIYTAGIHIITEVKGLLNLIWDNKTSLMVQLHPKFKGKVCGLCGNFDDNANNDFVKHNGEVVTDPKDFGNSWNVDPKCQENMMEPCEINSQRRARAERHCRIINSEVFVECNAAVDSGPYYDACVRDTYTCDSVVNCDRFCTAVAAYAAECRKKAVCVKWRTPDLCHVCCDKYNSLGECDWHYESCEEPCIQTCRNPSCSDQIPLVEG